MIPRNEIEGLKTTSEENKRSLEEKLKMLERKLDEDSHENARHIAEKDRVIAGYVREKESLEKQIEESRNETEEFKNLLDENQKISDDLNSEYEKIICGTQSQTSGIPKFNTMNSRRRFRKAKTHFENLERKPRTVNVKHEIGSTNLRNPETKFRKTIRDSRKYRVLWQSPQSNEDQKISQILGQVSLVRKIPQSFTTVWH